MEIVIPSLFSSILEDIVWQVTALYAGQTKDIHILAAIGMVQNMNMLLPYSLTFGTGRALCTLVSQSMGQGNHRQCAEYLNHQLIVVTSWFFPLILFMFNSSWLLQQVGMNREASDVTQNYAKILLWGFYMDSMYQSVKLYLLSLEDTFIPLVQQTVSVLLHPLWCYLIMTHTDYGINGCAIAQDITYTLQFVMLMIYLCFSSDPQIQ